MGIRFNKRHWVYSKLLLVMAALALILIGAGIVLRGDIERRFIYFPIRQVETDPSRLGLPFEDVFFVTGDGIKLHGWFVPGAKKLTWLWFHGNAGNISHRLEKLAFLHENLGVNIFIFDYRGYGNSEGKPSEEGTYLDAEAAVSYLYSRTDVQNKPLIFFGQSLGTAIAIETATRYAPDGMILESSFPSVPYMARILYPFVPAWLFPGTQYDSLAKISHIEVPLLFLHGDKDGIVPLEAGQKLFEAAKGEKTFYVIHGAGHNDTYLIGGQDYFQELLRFIQKIGQDVKMRRQA